MIFKLRLRLRLCLRLRLRLILRLRLRLHQQLELRLRLKTEAEAEGAHPLGVDPKPLREGPSFLGWTLLPVWTQNPYLADAGPTLGPRAIGPSLPRRLQTLQSGVNEIPPGWSQNP